MSGLVTVIIGIVIGMGVTSFAQRSETPGIDRRQSNQEQRIDQGIASDQLTGREANRLNRQQDRVDRMENRAKADGKITNRERKALKHAQDQSSKSIARQKHDHQGARHQ
ncbi:MAG: hypothetical protein ACT4OO_05985 [Nitrospiraceae bacterium]